MNVANKSLLTLNRVLVLLCIVVWFGCALPADTSYAAEEAYCGDFLALTGNALAALEFLECRRERQGNWESFKALYRVRGSQASGVETALAQLSGLTPLRFVCCLWEAVPTQEGRYGHLPHTLWPAHPYEPAEFEVGMVSEETLYSTRDQWLLIPWFHVWVSSHHELP